jgi:Tol biopolymer transport system component
MKKKSPFYILFLLLQVAVNAQPVSIVMFREHGLDVAWDKSGSNRIAYSAKGPDGYYDVHLSDPNTLDDTCITCNSPLLPGKHIAAPDWHPSGKWLLITAEKHRHDGGSFAALPGLGGFTDIWLINTKCTKAYQLTDIPNDKEHGIIMPHFSHDGKHIIWTNRKKSANLFVHGRLFGFWTINIADFSFGKNGVPRISNIKILEPDGSDFYESYGYSPDDKLILFCSNMNQRSTWDEHIYTMDTSGHNIKKLTEKNYNEHAFYTPDGNKIVWMTNTGTKKGTDWWIMNGDGSNKERLTYFNDKKSDDYAGKTVWCGFGSFNADGTEFAGGRQVSLITQEGQIVRVKLRGKQTK